MRKMKVYIYFVIMFLCFLCSCGKVKKDNTDKIVSYEESILENEVNQMFYGEWEVTDCIYVDMVPVNGVEYTEEEIQKVKENILEKAWKEIQFIQSGVVIDDSEKWENVKYNMVVFPSDDDYKIHFTMQLADIGLTENDGKYYLFVEVQNDDGLVEDVICFFVKSQNEIIVYKGSYCILYERKSYEGGNPEIVVIKG